MWKDDSFTKLSWKNYSHMQKNELNSYITYSSQLKMDLRLK